MAKRLQRGVFVDWPKTDGFISSMHPFWDKEEMWVSKDEPIDDGLRHNPQYDWSPETIWWREKLHFPYKNRHGSRYGPNYSKPHIPYYGNANREYAQNYANNLPINIFDLSSPHTTQPDNWRTACMIQFQNQGDPEIWMKANQGKITQGKAYWTLRGVSNDQNWMAIGFFNTYGMATFREMGFIFEDGREYTGKKAQDILKSQYMSPISINSYLL